MKARTLLRLENLKESRWGFLAEADFKSKLKTDVCFGTFLKLPRPEVVEILALCGFDFVICDMEHAQMTEREARDVIRAGVAANIPVIVRLPDPSQGLVNRLLEAGATGIQMPRLKSAQDIQHLYRIMHYPPLGVRSFGNANLTAGYGTVPMKAYIEKENARVVTVGQYETKEMEQPYEQLFEGLDVAFIGPADLSVDFGSPGQIDHPLIQSRIDEIEKLAAKTNTTLGIFVADAEQAKRYVEKGYRCLAVAGDISMLLRSAQSLIRELKGE